MRFLLGHADTHVYTKHDSCLCGFNTFIFCRACIRFWLIYGLLDFKIVVNYKFKCSCFKIWINLIESHSKSLFNDIICITQCRIYFRFFQSRPGEEYAAEKSRAQAKCMFSLKYLFAFMYVCGLTRENYCYQSICAHSIVCLINIIFQIY